MARRFRSFLFDNVSGKLLTGVSFTLKQIDDKVEGTAEIDGNKVSDFAKSAIQTSSKTFSDSDTIIMTAAAIDDRIIDSISTKAPLASPTFTGTVTADGLSLGDNDKATFGNSNDLEIYHDGSASFITDIGTGNLRIQGTNLALQNAAGTKNYLLGIDGGATTVYYDNAAKLVTTSTGIDVTGSIVVSGTVDGRDVAADGATIDGLAAVATSGSYNDLTNTTPEGASTGKAIAMAMIFGG